MIAKDDLLRQIAGARKSKDIEALQKLAQEAEQSGFFDINFYILGIMYQLQRNYSLSIEFFNKALEINPKNTRVFSLLANSYLGAGKYEESIKTNVDYLNNGGDKYIYYYNTGLAYKLSGKYQEAISAFLQAEELKASAKVYYNISDVSLKLGNLDLFNSYFEKACLLLGKPEKEADLLKLIEKVANLCNRRQKFDLAIACCEKALRIKNSSVFHIIKAISYICLKQQEKVIEECNFALEISQDGFVYYLMADAFTFNNQLIDVISNLRKAIELEPQTIDLIKDDKDFKFLEIPKDAKKDDILRLLDQKQSVLNSGN